MSAIVLSSPKAAMATLALNAGEWFRRGRLLMCCSPANMGSILAHRSSLSTFSRVQFCAATSKLLSAHNVKTNQTAFRMRADKDVTVEFRFSEPFFQLKGGVLSARQASLADVQALVAKAEKPKSKAGKSA
jgi:hypothetical protein